jgi:Dual-action HEIGH metallo-peptidase
MMRKLLFSAISLAFFGIVGCQKDSVKLEEEPISHSVLSEIRALGFGTSNVQKHEEGFLVEGDIVITPEMLGKNHDHKLLRVANAEQYRTTNLVTALPRVITISVSSKMSAKYVTATDAAIARFNAENLLISMQRVSSGANIAITPASRGAQYLASAGFPTSAGAPYNSVKVNTAYLDQNAWDNNSITSILAHEIGHCIGFRHTDYMDRSYSCGGALANEGASTVGAIHIPGTPTTADPNSWMLACIGKNVNRPFNANDKVALDFLY